MACDLKMPSVSVDFFYVEAVQEALNHTLTYKNPQVVMWYIGPNGLKLECVKFYRENIINPLLLMECSLALWLIDLTCWKAFKGIKSAIFKKSCCVDKINGFGEKRVKCFSAADIFTILHQDHSYETHQYIKKILAQDFTRRASNSFDDRGVTVGEILPGITSLIYPWSGIDVAKAYSIFQYLEGCLLVDRIVSESSLTEGCINIVFLLPNDELEYYRDSANTFQKDIEFFVRKQCIVKGIEIREVRVSLIAFPYGRAVRHRPYNTPGKAVNCNKLYIKDIIGEVP